MKKNDSVTLTIDDIGTDGQGIGKYEGMAVFVQGALPSEEVQAKIILVKKSYAVGKLMEILSPSPARVQPPCRVFSKCGGCTLQHMAYPAQLEYKQARVQDCVKRIGKLDIPVLFPLPSVAEYRYRNKAAFPAQQQNGNVSIGLYAAHSHNVVDIDDCKIQHSNIAVALSQLRVWIVKYGIGIYDEQTHTGLLRHVVFRSNKAGDIMLILVINGKDLPFQKELFALFKFVLPQVKSIVLNHNTTDTNVILGEHSTGILGCDFFFETVLDLEFKVSPGSFLQVNTPQAEALYKNLEKELGVRSSDTALDLFCGAGMITLMLAKQARFAYGIEVVDAAVENAQFNAQLNEIENAAFFSGDALEVLPKVTAQETHIDIVTVDPPRKGLTQPLIDAIVGISPRAVGYVSCDPATMARDLAYFAEKGYVASSIQPVDLFPQTTHVECVTVLKKQ